MVLRGLSACIGSPRFEAELHGGGADTAFTRLSALAGLDRALRRASLNDQRRICKRLGDLVGKVEADARLRTLLARCLIEPRA